MEEIAALLTYAIANSKPTKVDGGPEKIWLTRSKRIWKLIQTNSKASETNIKKLYEGRHKTKYHHKTKEKKSRQSKIMDSEDLQRSRTINKYS